MWWGLVVLVLVLMLAIGPLALGLVLVLLCVPQVRARVPWPSLSWKGAGISAAVVALVSAIVVVVPDGVLPIPGAGGLLATPAYQGQQASAKPLDVGEPAQHPWLADSLIDRPGPLGDQPEADSAWYGMESCRSMQFATDGRLVTLCRDRKGPLLRVVDADSLRPLATKRLPDRVETDDPVRADVCSGSRFYLDNGDRAIVATTDGRIQSIGTADADGEADLTVAQTWNLTKLIGDDDCLVRALPDWSGRIWWASYKGKVGMLDTVAGGAKILDLDERITQPFTVDESGVFLTSEEAVYRLVVDETGSAAVSWRTEYDRGVEVKSGQSVQGTGSGPVLVDDNLVALADNAEPRLQVTFHDRSTGAEVCKSAVFDGGESSTETSLVSVGNGVLVTNAHGNDSFASTALGFTPTGGIARVDHSDGECRVVWTNEASSVYVRPTVSWATGLAYIWTKRPSALGVSAWYMSAIDVRTGKDAFSVRTGTGFMHTTDLGYVALGPDGAAFVGTRRGIVRVKDVERE
ncbi:hypothetical protein [Nocardioides gilvus]|uniref:hypothetical protein n=1 Tax=Nocardioides gilvus TaxID=1735589 RepID=UPI000D74164E|nr:hypothetical protein [Nocardioides gilvus]